MKNACIRFLLLMIFIYLETFFGLLSGQNQNMNASLPADQVFLHYDRTLYSPGDTIWFQAYIRDRQTFSFETRSLSLFVLLINSKQVTIDSARFRISNSTVTGWLKIPDEQTDDNCKILAFTSQMMNYSPEYIFSAPVLIKEIEQSQKPARRNVDIIDSDQLAYMHFSPEGGRLIYGFYQRIAFKVISENGEPQLIKGKILNQKNDMVCDFISDEYGLGFFEFTPVYGNTYYAVIENDKFKNQKWFLPVPDSTGITLRADYSKSDKIIATIYNSGSLPGPYFLNMKVDENIVLSNKLFVDSLLKITINTDSLPRSIACLEILDWDSIPVAERFGLINKEKIILINISTYASEVDNDNSTELLIKAFDKDTSCRFLFLSLSVIDSSFGFTSKFPLPNIENTLLFGKDFYSSLTHEFKFSEFTGYNSRDIDLLLMTVDNRTRNILNTSDSTQPLALRNYDKLSFTIPKSLHRAWSEINILGIESKNIYQFQFNDSHSISLDSLNSLDKQIMIIPNRKQLRTINMVDFEFPRNQHFINEAKKIKPPIGNLDTDKSTRIKPPIEISDTDKLYKQHDLKIAGIDSIIMIDEVIIKGYRPVVQYSNTFQEHYQLAPTSTRTQKELTGCFNFEDALHRFGFYFVDSRTKVVKIRPLHGPALFVVDGIPLYENGKSTYSLIETMPVNQISSITVLKDSRGFTFYGEDAIGGVIFVTTTSQEWKDMRYADKKNAMTKTNLLDSVRIFRSEEEFYFPKEKDWLSNPNFKLKPTILWQDDIIIKNNSSFKISIPNNLIKGTLMITVNGVSDVNNMGSSSYKVSHK